MRLLALLISATALAACAAPETSRRAEMELSLPPMKTFASPAPLPSRLSNTQIASDFMELAFVLENGVSMPALTRFEGPVTIRVMNARAPSLAPDLSRLLERLRREAGINIRQVPETEPANITVEPVRRAQIQAAAPSAACFVRPNVSSWAEYRQRRNDPDTFWNRLSERTRMAVFLPYDVSPQEIRDCLHEEISQALGPVNDVYRLSQSIFNDDNFHTVLTGYDMLILRAYYDPALRNGMSEAEVAARLPGILRRINPAGGSLTSVARIRSSETWDRAIDTATLPRFSRSARIRAGKQAVDLAMAYGSNDTRLAFSYYVLGRLLLQDAPGEALALFLKAGRIYQNRPDTAVQEAHVAMQLAAFQLSAGRADIAIALVDQSLPVVTRSEHAALLSLMLMVKAEALMLKGEIEESERVQQEAVGWARYGFGAPETIKDRLADIEAISPRTRTGGAI